MYLYNTHLCVCVCVNCFKKCISLQTTMFIYRAYLNTTKVVAPPIVIRLFLLI